MSRHMCQSVAVDSCWRGSIGIAVLAACLAMLDPAPAAACTCPSSYGTVAWPAKDAVDVPLDTPLVVGRYNLHGPTDAVAYALLDASGKPVTTVEKSRLPAAFDGCGQEEIVFLRPEKPLDAHATYQLTIHTDTDPQQQFASEFTTGDSSFESEPEIDADLIYLLVTQEQQYCAAGRCLSIAEAYVDLGERPKAPRWLRVESAGSGDNRNAFTFWPQDTRIGSTWQLSVALPEDDQCIDVDVYGIEGVPLFHAHRCKPNRCARYSRWGGSSCGDPPMSSVDAARIPAGTCADPPVLEFDKGIVYPKSSMTPREASASSGSEGCSAISGASTSWWLASIVPLMWRTRRRIIR